MEVLSPWDPGGNLPVLDVFVTYPMDFDTLIRDSVRIDIGGVIVTVASIDHLIEMKAATGREKDSLDAAALRERDAND